MGRKIDGILKSFRKTMKKLDALIEENNQQIDANNDNIKGLIEENNELRLEVMQAEEARDSIADIIGEKTLAQADAEQQAEQQG